MNPFKVTLLLSLFLIPVTAFSTPQIPDRIIYKGEVYDILNMNPLEIIFEKHPEKRPQTEIISSGLWRGYMTTFEIVGDELYIKDIGVRDSIEYHGTRWRSVLKEVFPGEEKAEMDWFTGILELPDGEQTNLYECYGCRPEYTNYILLEFHNGKLIKELNLSFDEYETFKERQTEAFMKTQEYEEIKRKTLNKYPNMKEEGFDSSLKDNITYYSKRILVD